MAHRIKVYPEPHRNKDGSESKTKKDWFFRDRHRSGVHIEGPFTSRKAVEERVGVYRDELVALHAKRHPNDKFGLKTQPAPTVQKRDRSLKPGERYFALIEKVRGSKK